MKKALTNAPLVIETGRGRGGDAYFAKGKTGTPKKTVRATSTGGEESAAKNLATRHFFGGHTNADGIGLEEREAIRLQKLGPNQWVASVKFGGVV